MKKIFLGSDHAGFKLKEEIKKYLKKKNYKFEDLGNIRYEKNDDYPDYAYEVARRVAKEKSKGILFCGSGQGICIVANKVKGIRAVNVNNVKDAKRTREDSDANILCLSGWDLSKEKAKKIINVWLKTLFSNLKRHKRRLEKIKRIEK